MKWKKNHRIQKITLLIGLTLIISALSIWGYSIIELNTNQSILMNQNSTMEQIWKAEGALQWWTNFYPTTAISVTAVLTLSGIAIILSPKLIGLKKQETVLNQFEKSIQDACQL